MASIKSMFAALFQFALSSFLLLGLSSQALAQTMREEAVAFDKPNGKPTNIRLSAGSNVKVLRRDGFWIEVDVGGKTGWLKASQVSFSASQSGAVSIDTGRMGSGNIVSTSAARGLSAKDLLSGQPNFHDVSRLEATAVDPKEIQSFVLAGGLKPPPSSIKLIPLAPIAGKIPSPTGTVPSQDNSPPSGKKKADDDW